MGVSWNKLSPNHPFMNGCSMIVHSYLLNSSFWGIPMAHDYGNFPQLFIDHPPWKTLYIYITSYNNYRSSSYWSIPMTMEKPPIWSMDFPWFSIHKKWTHHIMSPISFNSSFRKTTCSEGIAVRHEGSRLRCFGAPLLWQVPQHGKIWENP